MNTIYWYGRYYYQIYFNILLFQADFWFWGQRQHSLIIHPFNEPFQYISFDIFHCTQITYTFGCVTILAVLAYLRSKKLLNSFERYRLLTVWRVNILVFCGYGFGLCDVNIMSFQMVPSVNLWSFIISIRKFQIYKFWLNQWKLDQNKKKCFQSIREQ